VALIIDALIVIFGLSFWFVVVSATIIYTSPVLKSLISNEWAMIPALCAAIILYRLRGSRPFMYGIAEVIVGMTATWSGIHAGTTSVITQALAFFGGMYVVVRGMDNMDKDLPPKMRRWWNILFPKAKHH